MPEISLEIYARASFQISQVLGKVTLRDSESQKSTTKNVIYISGVLLFTTTKIT